MARRALTGLLRSKSGNSSPMAGRSQRSPARVSPAAAAAAAASLAQAAGEAVLDIEDCVHLGSSFFSDTEVGPAPPPKDLVLHPQTDLVDGLDFDFLDGIDIGEPEPEPAPPAQRLHRRVQVQQVEHFAGCARLHGLDLGARVQLYLDVSGEWLRCLPPQAPFIVHVVLEHADYTIGDAHGFLVVYPETLLSATLVADSISCSRRAVLSSRVQAAAQDNKPSASLICGSVVHEVVERSLLAQQYDLAHLCGLVPEEIRKSLVDIYCADSDEAAILAQVHKLLQGFPDWAHRFIEGAADTGSKRVTDDLAIRQVVKTEENIWSHAFGLKGKIDGTLLVHDVPSGRLLLAPFELKTGYGTTSVAHRAQATLYGFMLWDRYGIRVEESLLFYIAKSELFRLRPSRADLRSLLMVRNMLAVQMNSAALPAVISNKHVCSKCYQLETCTMHYRLVERGQAEGAPSEQHLALRTTHLGPNIELLADFYGRWERLVRLEEQEAVAARQHLWTSTMEERVRQGNCLADLSLVGCAPVLEPTSFGGFRITFALPPAAGALEQTHLGEGDPIVISAADQAQFGLAIGYLQAVSATQLVVVSDRPLENSIARLSAVLGQSIPAITRYRVDKDDLTSSFGLLRTNLLKLAAPESRRLMELVVRLAPPAFDASRAVFGGLEDEYRRLDACQQEAVRRILETQDYCLVLGMPGTGKSTTLAFAIRLLVALGRTVLLSSHTHSAVDNILLKLRRGGWDGRLARFGNPDKVAAALHDVCFEAQRFGSVAQMEAFYMNARLVACTALGSNHPLLGRRVFDVCIVDEASQISVPSCLGPLRLAASFVLVGDHYQLPPLVRSKAALAEGLNQSLFSVLAAAHPAAVVMLRLQYRMNEEIMAISNQLVYGGMLTCGNELVAQARLALPRFGALSCRLCGSSGCWLDCALDPGRPVLFLNTDACQALEAASGNSYRNQDEAALIGLLLAALGHAGLPDSEVAIISPYRPQLKLLQALVPPSVSVSTVDKFQGLDADCILISLVRSNPEQNIGQLLRDWARLNVAFTRAKRKLILVGSASTVLQQGSFGELDRLLRSRGWVLDLPADALRHTM